MDYFILTYCRAPIGSSNDAKLYYNFTNSCNKCGTGAKLAGNLQVTGINNVKKEFFETLNRDYIISEKLYISLRNEGLQLGNLKNIVDYKYNTLPYFHLYTDIILPESYKKTGIEIENQCPVCKRNGFFNKTVIGCIEKNIPTYVYPVDLHYSSSELKKTDKSDFYFTWECFGYSNLVAHGNNVVGLARPLLVVNQKFKDILEKLKVKGLEFELIAIDNL